MGNYVQLEYFGHILLLIFGNFISKHLIFQP